MQLTSNIILLDGNKLQLLLLVYLPVSVLLNLRVDDDEDDNNNINGE